MIAIAIGLFVLSVTSVLGVLWLNADRQKRSAIAFDEYLNHGTE